MTAYMIRLTDLIRRIRDEANRAAPEFRDYADANADLEVRDVTERLNCCEDDDERDALVRRWLHVRGAA